MKITDNIYGTFEFPDKFDEIISSESVQRLKRIHQNGADFLIEPRRSATRFEHSIGVMILIKILGGSEEEQIAGLLHDISHTVFSHTIDQVKARKNHDYHEEIKHDYLKNTQLLDQLKKIGMEYNRIIDEENFPMLDSPIPDICADRLDYFFRDMLNIGRISKEQINQIIEFLVFKNGKLQCKSIETSKLIFEKFLELNSEVFFEPKLEVVNIIMSTLIKRLHDDGHITEKDFLLDDEYIINKILKSRDIGIFLQLNQDIKFKVSTTETRHFLQRKLRYMDPLVAEHGKRLTEIDEDARRVLEKYLKTPAKQFYEIPVLDKLNGG